MIRRLFLGVVWQEERQIKDWYQVGQLLGTRGYPVLSGDNYLTRKQFNPVMGEVLLEILNQLNFEIWASFKLQSRIL